MNTPGERLIGRETEMRRLRAALRKRQSQLIWGASDAGKSFLIANALAELPENERRKCICCAGAASRRQLVEQWIRGLYAVGNPFVLKKAHADRSGEASLSPWIKQQSMVRLRGILFTAAEHGEYRFIVDDLPPPSHTMAHLMKEVLYRAKTPIYLTGCGYSQAEIGYAWSLYWADEYRIHVAPLAEEPARELLEICIERFGLGSLDLEGFREDVLHLSGHLPGSIVKMCQMAVDPRYHFGDQVKVKLVHVDYLMQGGGFSAACSAGHSS